MIETFNAGGSTRGNKQIVLSQLAQAGYELYQVCPASQRKPWVLFMPNVSPRVNSPIGNYLAVPSWAKAHVAHLLEPADLRVFTPHDVLLKMRDFLVATKNAFN